MAALSGVVLALASCGGSDDAAVVRVSTFPWPEGPGPVIAAIKPGLHAPVPLNDIESAIPETFPENPEQTCNIGAKVEITFEDGRTLEYGPCNRPASIERLRLSLIRAYRNRR